MEQITKQFNCGQELMAEELNDIINLNNSIILYIRDHESEWSRSGSSGNKVQISSIGNSGLRIAKYKIDDNPEGYIYAPTTTPGLNGDTTIIEPLEFNYNKVPIANFVAGNGSNTLYAPAPGSGSNGLNGQNGLDGLSTLFAFKGFANDNDAEKTWNSIKLSRNYPPGNVSDGWSTSSNVPLQTGHMLYMTTAQRQGNNYITVGGNIWQKPVRIGSSSDTSHTGTDDDNYNYIYCRTTTNVAPGLTGVVGQSSYGVHLLELIEADTVKGHGYKPVNDNSIDIATATIDKIDGAWTDHPYGVSSQLPFEWQVGFKKNETSGNWEYYFGPVIISHYGYDGLDGDGLEYIFYLLAKNLAGIPSLGAPYEGRIGENETTTLTKVSVNSTDYQLDDFIPTGWHDNPQTISEEYPRQYVSTRKKEGALEIGDLWQEFTPPRLWNIYATNGFLATLNNDSIIFDDDSDSDAIEYVSLTKAFLWDGANDVTLSNNYSKVTVTITCVGFSDKLRPGMASIDGNDVSVGSGTDWGTPMEINRSNYTGFALTKREGVGKLETKTGSITYTIKAYESGNDDTPKIEASRILTILVVDINDGTAYSLQVTPNTLGVSRTNETSPYTLRDAQSITVTATAASGKKVEKITIKNCNSNSDIQNIEDNNLYVEVKDSEGTLLGITPLEFFDTKSLVYTLGNTLAGRILSDGLDSIQYIVVDLYYKYLGQGIKIDSETVDFSVKGDRGLDGTGQGTESYVITTFNDNAVIDDLTLNWEDLKDTTLNTYTVLKGNSYVTQDCYFSPIAIDLPDLLELCTYLREYNTDTETITPINVEENVENISNEINSFVLRNKEPNSDNITPGNYYYDIGIYHENTNNLIATKRFKLYVDANISSDGSSYKLRVENDVVYYNYDGTTVLSSDSVVISAYKRLNGLLPVNIDYCVASMSEVSTIEPDKLYLVLGDSNLEEAYSGIIQGSAYILRQSIPYNVNGYADITLYKGSQFVEGPERIDCIKYGGPGEDGYTVTSNNDNSIFGIFMTDFRLNIASSQTLTVYKGSQNITSNCTYRVSANNLISDEFKIQYSNDGNNWVDVIDTAVQGANNFRILLAPHFNSSGKNFTPGKYYYDVTITHGSYSTTKRHKIIVRSDYYSFILNFEPDGLIYDENNSVISTSDPKIRVFDRLGDECEFSAVESLPSTITATIYAVMGPLLNYLRTKPSGQLYYEVDRTRLPYISGGYPVTLYYGEELVDGPEIFSCVKDKSATYDLEPYPTVLKFNVAPDGKTLIPSEVVARCKISKKFEDSDPIFSNNNQDGYYMYYNITDKDGHMKNISGITGNEGNGWYVIYNNSDDVNAGLHISKDNLDYTLVNFYLSKAKTLDLLTHQDDLYYTNDISPIIKQVSIPILRDGLKGDSGESSTGQIGKFYYFAGDWIAGNHLIVTAHLYPYVYYNGEYFMYVGEPNPNNTYKNPVDNLDVWEKITYNKFLISETMFAKYAQLGALIVNGDWMISQYGTYNGSPSWSAYVNFDPIAFMTHLRPNEGASIGVIPRTNGSNLNLPSSLMFLIRQSAYIDVKVDGLTKLIKVSQYRLDNSGEITYDNNAIEYSFNGNGTATINGDSSVWYCFVGGIVSDIKVKYSNVNSVFIPNYAVDLRSGFTYLNNAYVKGLVSTVNDLIVIKEESQNLGTWATISDRGLFCRNDMDTPSPSLNEVLASIKVHKYTDTYGYTSLSGEVELRRRLNGSSNWNYASLTGSGLTFAYHEGNSIPNQTEISALKVHTATVQTPIVYGGDTIGVGGSMIPTAFPGNIITGSGTKSLPSSPIKGMIIFAKGTDGDMTIDGNGKNIMAANSASLDTSISIGRTSWIFMYDGTQWIRFSGKE